VYDSWWLTNTLDFVKFLQWFRSYWGDDMWL